MEVFTIPAAVLSYAQTNNLSTIYYSRSFSVGTEGFTQLRFFTINLSYLPPTLNITPGIVSFQSPSVLWNITTYGDGSGTISSTAGIFSTTPYIGQTTLGSSSLVLTTPNLPATGTTSVPENIQIPQLVLDAAQTAKLQSIYYIRSFSGNPCAPQASCPYTTNAAPVQINLAISNPNATLNINRIALRFSDNTSVKVIAPETSLTALADISFNGSGLFDAMWEIAEPVSTIGQPVFVPMRPVRQFLVAGGRVYLQTPPLPTQKQGLHILRLRVTQPTLNFATPVLQFSVNPQGDISVAPAQPPVRINSPVDNALLAGDTRFDWQPVKGARAYQLDLFLPEQSGLKPDDAAIAKRPPATGIMVPGKRNSLALGELSRSHLRPGTTYYWRILAIGDKGQILSTSALREIRIP
jgi:hypothetical protein